MSTNGTNDGTWIAQSTLVAGPATPTKEVYEEFQQAYSTFNEQLFQGILPECIITLQRAAGSYGYFCQQRFVHRDGKVSDEIALNPTHFASRTTVVTLSTLAHEMAHLAECHFGKKGRAGYHNKSWGKRMLDIGLHPSSTGQPGGRLTGYRMTHYIVEGGPFDVLTARMVSTGFRLSWADANFESNHGIAKPTVAMPGEPDEGDGSNRWRYTCPKCGLNLWGKPNSPAGCWKCMLPMPRSIGRSVRS